MDDVKDRQFKPSKKGSLLVPVDMSRTCPLCQATIVYKSDQSWRQAERGNKCCRDCADEKVRKTTRDINWRETHAQSLREAWANPDSTLNTKEYRKTLSDAQTQRWMNTTEEERDRLSLNLKKRWVVNHDRWTESLRNASRTEEHRKKQSDAIQKYWKTAPQSAHKAISDRSKRLMLDPEHKRRCTEKLIEAAQRTGGTSKQELEIAKILAPLGFIHKWKISHWWVDFYNPTTDTVVEYFGDWWHAHPRYHKRINEQYNGIHPNQGTSLEHVIEHDRVRLNNIKMCVQKVIVLWESDVKVKYDNKGVVMNKDKILEIIEVSK